MFYLLKRGFENEIGDDDDGGDDDDSTSLTLQPFGESASR
jgi:hypothetical protein